MWHNSNCSNKWSAFDTRCTTRQCNINDLPEVAETVFKLFSDDTTTYSTVNSAKEARAKQLIINLLKIKTNCENKYNEEEVDEEDDVGIIIDIQLSFNSHITSKIALVNRNVCIMFRTFSYLETITCLHLCTYNVRLLQYTLTLWSPHLKCTKYLLKCTSESTHKLSNISFFYHGIWLPLGLPSILYWRLRMDMIQVFKTLHGWWSPVSGWIHTKMRKLL